MSDTEVHSVLNKQEMSDITAYRVQLAYKTPEESEKMLYDWTKAGKISRREHSLLCKYIYQGY